MQVSLKPCPYRIADNDGRILCNQIKNGDRQVSAGMCQACPIAEIDCAHLRSTLSNPFRAPLTIRWGNGKTEVWDDPAPPLVMERAACAAKTIPILSPLDCMGCSLRQALVLASAIPVMPARALPPTKPTIEPSAQARTNIVAQKILRLQEWLEQKKTQRSEEEEPGVLRLAFSARSVRSVAEERHVGWTD